MTLYGDNDQEVTRVQFGSVSWHQFTIVNKNVAIDALPEELSPSLQPTQSPSPSTSVQPTQVTTSEPQQEVEPCIDTPNYLDMYNGGCDLYELEGNEAWCEAYGNDGEAGMKPNENCCVCKAKAKVKAISVSKPKKKLVPF